MEGGGGIGLGRLGEGLGREVVGGVAIKREGGVGGEREGGSGRMMQRHAAGQRASSKQQAASSISKQQAAPQRRQPGRRGPNNLTQLSYCTELWFKHLFDILHIKQ